MKKSLLSLLALSAMVLSSCNQDKPTPEPVLPYQISASGKVTIENAVIVTTENGTTTEKALGNANLDFTNIIDKSVLAQVEYKDKKAVVDLGSAFMTKLYSVEEFLGGFGVKKAVISNKNAKVVPVKVLAHDINSTYIGSLQASNASATQKSPTVASGFLYVSEETAITANEVVDRVTYVVDVKARKGWNNLIYRFAKQGDAYIVNLSVNDVPATGVRWVSGDM